MKFGVIICDARNTDFYLARYRLNDIGRTFKVFLYILPPPLNLNYNLSSARSLSKLPTYLRRTRDLNLKVQKVLPLA